MCKSPAHACHHASSSPRISTHLIASMCCNSIINTIYQCDSAQHVMLVHQTTSLWLWPRCLLPMKQSLVRPYNALQATGVSMPCPCHAPYSWLASAMHHQIISAHASEPMCECYQGSPECFVQFEGFTSYPPWCGQA